MPDQKERILRLKAIQEEEQLTVQNIYDLMQAMGGDLSKSSVSRVFAQNSEHKHFRKETILILERTLSDNNSVEIEKIKSMEEKHAGELGQLQSQINYYEGKLKREKEKSDIKLKELQDKCDKEIEYLKELITQLNNTIKMLSEQISIKDKRMDQKDSRYDKLFERFDAQQQRFDTQQKRYDILQDQFLNRCENCNMKK